MTVSPLACKPATREMLVDVAALEREHYARRPYPQDPAVRVSYDTSGHRGSAFTARSGRRWAPFDAIRWRGAPRAGPRNIQDTGRD